MPIQKCRCWICIYNIHSLTHARWHACIHTYIRMDSGHTQTHTCARARHATFQATRMYVVKENTQKKRRQKRNKKEILITIASEIKWKNSLNYNVIAKRTCVCTFTSFSNVYIHMRMCVCLCIKFWMIPVLVIDVRNGCKRYANVQNIKTKQSVCIHRDVLYT